MNLIILGPQGSGKGTQALLLKEKLDFEHIEMGLLLRTIAQEDSNIGKKIDTIINQNKELAPNEIVYSVLRSEIGKISPNKGVIFDGVPRTISQMENVENILLEYGRKINAVIYISLPFEESIGRITKRFSCKQCKNRLILEKDIQSANDKCPKCGGEVTQRADDVLEGVTKRLNVFYDETIPVIEKYKERGILYEIDGRGIVEGVHLNILEKIKNL